MIVTTLSMMEAHSMAGYVILLALGILFVVKGGDWFVDAASWIAEVSGIPSFIIGATIVSVATTIPEILVSSLSAAQGQASMAIGNALTGRSGFQANPSQIDPVAGTMLLAHCTIPFNMVERYSYNTHFESGIGVAIHGEMAKGEVTIFKASADLGRTFCEEASLIGNQYGRDLCRTQVLLRFKKPQVLSEYFLRNPIGNHHIIFGGKHRDLFEEFMK